MPLFGIKNEKKPDTASVFPAVADGYIGVGIGMGVVVGKVPDLIACVSMLVLVINVEAFIS